MSYRADKLVIDTHTHRPTGAGDDNTRRPKLASGKNECVLLTSGHTVIPSGFEAHKATPWCHTLVVLKLHSKIANPHLHTILLTNFQLSIK